jgi:electron transport complex protein RnfG
MPAAESSPQAHPVRAVIYLVLFALAAAVTLASINRLTGDRIAANELAERLKALTAVLQVDQYNNEPHLDTITVSHPDLLGSDDPLPVYRARLDQQPVAAVLTAVAPMGFSGEIRLFISVYPGGEVAAVRVVQHRETPGLGDLIDYRKSDWIEDFTGLQTTELAADPLASAWTLDRDGGSFDRISGATVTSRAVLKAVRNAVLYFNTHEAEIFAPAAEIAPATSTTLPR